MSLILYCPKNGEVYSWNASNVAAQNATGVHHPQGDVMKISRANNAVTRIGYGGVAGNDHWQANWSPQNNGAGNVVTAVTEGGSSGSPLFDQAHRIVGQLHGGPSACGGAQLWDYYGSFDVSWIGGGTNATRLSNWLDPSGTNAVTTNTTNISALANANFTISGNANLCTAETYSVNTTVPITWSSTPTGYVNFSCTTCSTTTATRVTGVRGNITITATLATGCGASKAVSVGSPVAIGYTKSST